MQIVCGSGTFPMRMSYIQLPSGNVRDDNKKTLKLTNFPRYS